MTRVLAIDQGTTNTKAVVFDERLSVLGRASAPLTSTYPQSGWAEQSAEEIWASVQNVIAQSGPADAIAIANQRETLVVWDVQTGAPVGPAILWQCRRTSEDCAALADRDAEVTETTGLSINPLFPASKLGWVIRNRPEAAALTEKGHLRAGTVDAWLIWKLTGGAVFATDHSNASRTQLFDTAKLAYSSTLAEIFGCPINVLPEPRASDAGFGATAEGSCSLPAGVPIVAVMGDSHAALYGHGVAGPGEVKATFGTGSSLMTLTPERITSRHGLSGTIAWTAGRTTYYAIEGNITVSAQAADFAARMLGLPGVTALADLAKTITDAEGVTFVPALAGLGAPHWDDAARGIIAGMSLGTTPAQVARATFEAVAHQIADVFAAMEQDIGRPLATLRADGGASANDWLMQLQADLLGRPVIRRDMAEIGARGVAAMALSAMAQTDPQVGNGAAQTFAPVMEDTTRQATRRTWAKAVAQARFRAD